MKDSLARQASAYLAIIVALTASPTASASSTIQGSKMRALCGTILAAMLAPTVFGALYSDVCLPLGAFHIGEP